MHIGIYSSIFLINFHSSEGRIMVLSLLLSRSVQFILPLPCTIPCPQGTPDQIIYCASFSRASPNCMTSTEGIKSLVTSRSQQAFLPNAMAEKRIRCPNAWPGICPAMRQALKSSDKCINFILYVLCTLCLIRTGLSKLWITVLTKPQ